MAPWFARWHLVPANWGSPANVKIEVVTLPRDATDEYLRQAGHQLDIVFDVDLGELAQGHHIIARGIDFGRQVAVHRWEQEMQRDLEERIAEEMRVEVEGGGVGLSFQAFGRRTLTEREQEIVGRRYLESELHYEFVPGLRPDEGLDWYWMLQTFDDVGTSYSDSNGGVVVQRHAVPPLTRLGTWARGFPILPLDCGSPFSPAFGWVPPEPWVREMEIDLRSRSVLSTLVSP